jgi:ribosomal protein S18 acetylase RimI-like enzyme
MSTSVAPKSSGGPPPVRLRPEQPEDEDFLFQIYASTREEELALTNWDEPMRRAFLEHQFKAMRLGYRGMFPAAEFSIILWHEQPVGRMVVNRDQREIRVVDIALRPAQRNRGIGTVLIRTICAEAADALRPVHLCVLKHNRARFWYERLGFIQAGDQGVYDELEWRAPQEGQAMV